LISFLVLTPSENFGQTRYHGTCLPSVAWTSALCNESTPLLSVLMAVMVPPRVRSATAKNSAMAIAAGLIWRAIFVFIGVRFHLFLRKIFPSIAKIFEIRTSVEDYTGFTAQSEIKGKPI
jgi:hypothetical protein